MPHENCDHCKKDQELEGRIERLEPPFQWLRGHADDKELNEAIAWADTMPIPNRLAKRLADEIRRLSAPHHCEHEASAGRLAKAVGDAWAAIGDQFIHDRIAIGESSQLADVIRALSLLVKTTEETHAKTVRALSDAITERDELKINERSVGDLQAALERAYKDRDDARADIGDAWKECEVWKRHSADRARERDKLEMNLVDVWTTINDARRRSGLGLALVENTHAENVEALVVFLTGQMEMARKERDDARLQLEQRAKLVLSDKSTWVPIEEYESLKRASAHYQKLAGDRGVELQKAITGRVKAQLELKDVLMRTAQLARQDRDSFDPFHRNPTWIDNGWIYQQRAEQLPDPCCERDHDKDGNCDKHPQAP